MTLHTLHVDSIAPTHPDQAEGSTEAEWRMAYGEEGEVTWACQIAVSCSACGPDREGERKMTTMEVRVEKCKALGKTPAGSCGLTEKALATLKVSPDSLKGASEHLTIRKDPRPDGRHGARAARIEPYGLRA